MPDPDPLSVVGAAEHRLRYAVTRVVRVKRFAWPEIVAKKWIATTKSKIEISSRCDVHDVDAVSDENDPTEVGARRRSETRLPRGSFELAGGRDRSATTSPSRLTVRSQERRALSSSSIGDADVPRRSAPTLPALSVRPAA